MDRLAELFDKPMDRKDFLRQVGIGGMLLLGSNLIIKTIFGLGRDTKQASHGYGASAYGGLKR
jgi:hypothetical protein